jgi:hypothetical protein
MQTTVADIEEAFNTIQHQPNGHRYNAAYFAQRLAAANKMSECAQDMEAALIACFAEPEDLQQLPQPVRKAIGNSYLVYVYIGPNTSCRQTPP